MTKKSDTFRVAVLDDWQEVSKTVADWAPLMKRAEVEFFHDVFDNEDAVARTLSGFDAILAMRERTAFTDSLVDRLPRLKFFNMTGRRAYGLDRMIERGITVSITGGGEDGADTAEHTLALIMAASRHVPVADRSVRLGFFQKGVPAGTRLAGRTLGILGYGLIGGRVAGYGRALGMEVVCWSRSLTPGNTVDQGVRIVDRETLFSTADVLSVHLVLSDETRRGVGAHELALMKDGALLVNTARAALIDHAALVSELRRGRIRAALDVFESEPLSGNDPLTACRNVVLTPHLGYSTAENYGTFYRNSVENTLAFLDGKPIRLFKPAYHKV